MNTQTFIARITHPKTLAGRLRTGCTTSLLSLLLLLALPAAVEAQFNYMINNGTITITRYTGSGGDVVIPSSINGLPVTCIGSNAFWLCQNLTSITMPTSVTCIGDWAFEECHRLTSVTIPNSVTSIGGAAFSGCTSLTNITIPKGVASIRGATFYNCYSLTGVTIPNSVASIEAWAFAGCASLTNVSIPSSVISLGPSAFESCTNLSSITIPSGVTIIDTCTFCYCYSLASITIPSSVTSLGPATFEDCTNLTSVTIPGSVSSIGGYAFGDCPRLTGVYFLGNAPSADSTVFQGDHATIYYLAGTSGWGASFAGLPTALWSQVPAIQKQPQTQTAEAGSAVGLSVRASSPLPLFFFWYLNGTNLVGSGTNWQVELREAQFDQSGAYAVVISNVLGAITSAPALLNVIAPVERRPVPGVKVMGAAGSQLDVDYADSLSPTPDWTLLGSVSLASTSQYYFDLTLPLPPQRYYRAWQTGPPSVMPSLDLHLVPAITLAGNIGHSVRVDYINQFGPTDAWVTLATVTLTNTLQLYFDVSAPGHPQRLYRLVP